MDSLAVGSHGCLLKRLGEGRVSVAGSGNVLRRRLVLNRKDRRGDHLTGVGANDVHTENLVRLLLDQELDGSLRVGVRLGSRVGEEGELASLVLDTLLLEVLLSLTAKFGKSKSEQLGAVKNENESGHHSPNPCDLRVCVDDRRNGLVVDVTVAGLDNLDSGNTLLFGLVRQHGAKGGVTNALDALAGSVVLVVNDDAASLVLLNTNSLEVEALGHRSSADSDKNDVGVKLLLLTALGILNVEEHLAVLLLGVNNLGAHAELEALLLKHLLEGLAVIWPDGGDRVFAEVSKTEHPRTATETGQLLTQSLRRYQHRRSSRGTRRPEPEHRGGSRRFPSRGQ